MFINTATKVLQSKYFWIIIGVVVAYILIRRNWYRLASIGRPRVIEYETDENGSVIGLSEETKRRLRDLAHRARTQRRSIFGRDYEVFRALNYLNDQELEYTAKYYKQAYSVTLFADIDAQLLAGMTEDDELLTKLERIGQS